MPRIPCAKQEGPWHALCVGHIPTVGPDLDADLVHSLLMSDYKHSLAWRVLTKGHGHV